MAREIFEKQLADLIEDEFPHAIVREKRYELSTFPLPAVSDVFRSVLEAHEFLVEQESKLVRRVIVRRSSTLSQGLNIVPGVTVPEAEVLAQVYQVVKVPNDALYLGALDLLGDQHDISLASNSAKRIMENFVNKNPEVLDRIKHTLGPDFNLEDAFALSVQNLSLFFVA